ncbi:MAG: RES domain-containing protein [Sulfitobacter sp.]|jgi:RES domain-containing protein
MAFSGHLPFPAGFAGLPCEKFTIMSDIRIIRTGQILMNETAMTRLSGRFYRIVLAAHRQSLLKGVISPEGRFHHSCQPALYLSSRQDWAGHAIARYIGRDDPPRVICELDLSQARMLDLRKVAPCRALGIDPDLAAVPWLPERAEHRFASSWQVADQARATGADGLIYQARSAPERWHLVLFRWNSPDAPLLRDRHQDRAFLPPTA